MSNLPCAAIRIFDAQTHTHQIIWSDPDFYLHTQSLRIHLCLLMPRNSKLVYIVICLCALSAPTSTSFSSASFLLFFHRTFVFSSVSIAVSTLKIAIIVSVPEYSCVEHALFKASLVWITITSFRHKFHTFGCIICVCINNLIVWNGRNENINCG